MIKDFEEKAIKLLNEFCVEEYGKRLEDEDLKDLSKISFAYTEYEKGEFEELDKHLTVSAFLNLKDLKIWVEYNGVQVYEEKYDTQDEFLEQLNYLDFDAWTNLDHTEEEAINWLIADEQEIPQF